MILPPKFNSLVPELDVRDIERSQRFYTEVLGFKVEYTRIGFALLSYGEAQLMLSAIRVDGWYSPVSERLGEGVNLQIRTTELHNLLERVTMLGYQVRKGPYEVTRESWGELVTEREIHIFDPDGYFLRFSEVIDRREGKPI